MSMGNLDYKEYYRRRLPHIQPPGATLFITSRLAGSLPVEVEKRLKAERREILIALRTVPKGSQEWEEMYLALRLHFAKYDKLLDHADYGPIWLSNPRIANLLASAIHHRDGLVYDLDAFSIMSNHFHLEMTPLQEEDGTYIAMSAIMHSLKTYTARKANKLLNREGQFWQHESYDHYARHLKEQERIAIYIVNNPVEAGLASNWEDWPWTYWKGNMPQKP